MDNLDEGSKPSLTFLAHDKKNITIKNNTNYSTLEAGHILLSEQDQCKGRMFEIPGFVYSVASV
jgi:hypothetical protein